MFCTDCGTKVVEGSAHCTSCGTAVGGSVFGEARGGGESAFRMEEASIPKGCLILIVSFFTMPIKTAGVAANELRQIARIGSIETDNDFPHLSWFKATLPVVATIVLALILFYGFAQLFTGYEPISTRIGTFVGLIFIAIFVDWLFMWTGEAMTAYIVSAQYYSKQLRKD